VPDAHLLGALNVRYVLSEFDIVAEGLTLQTTIGTTRIYENAFDAGRVQGGAIVLKSPNKIVIATNSSDKVGLAEIAYPGWIAIVDGVAVPVEQDGIFRTVTVTPGAHTLSLEFQPTLILGGTGIERPGLIAGHVSSVGSSMSRVTRSEWVWVSVFAILVMALTSVALPYWLGAYGCQLALFGICDRRQ